MFCLLHIQKAQSQTSNYYYNALGNGVSDTLSWGFNPDGSGTNPSNFTSDSSVFNFTGINNASPVALPFTWSVTGAGSKISIGTGVKIWIDSGGLAANTLIDVLSGGILRLKSTHNVSLNYLDIASTVEYVGKANLTIIPASYGNLVSINDSSGKRKLSNNAIINVAGIFHPGNAAYSDSSIFTFNGTQLQHIPTNSYYSRFIANQACVVDSGAVLTIKSGGKLTVNPGDSLNILPGATLEYHSSKSIVITGAGLHISNDANFNITANLSSVPSGTSWDSTSNLNIGNGNTSVKTLAKLSSTDIYGNVTINAPSVNTALGGRILSSTAGTYTINGNLNVLAGRVTNSSGSINKTLSVGGDLNISGGSYYISDSSQNTFLDKLDIGGDVKITGGELFITHDTATTFTGKGELLVAGDLIHTGGLFGNAPNSITTGKIMFTCTDTAGQSFSTIGFTEGTPGLVRLQVNGGQEVELLSNLTVNDTVVIASGYFTVTAGNTFTLNNGAKGYNSGNYIITDAVVGDSSRGIVRYNNIPKNKWTIIPVGNDSTYQPVSVYNTADSGSFSVTTFNGITQNGNLTGTPISDSAILSDYVNSTWYINRNDTGTNTIKMRLRWDSIMQGASFTLLPDSNITVLQNNGTGGAMAAISTSGNNNNDTANFTFIQSGIFQIGNLLLFSCPVNTWTGNISTAWEDNGNWSCGKIPTGSTDVYINTGITNYPVINSTAFCKSIHIANGAAVSVNTGNLQITGHQ